MVVHEAGEYKADILAVDDTPVHLRLLAIMLAEQGYRVRLASSGAEALLEVEKEPPDLILLDIHLGDLDGYEVCRRLKTERRTRDVPIVFMGDVGDVLDWGLAFTVGGVDYIPKPFQLGEVLARVEHHLELRRLQDELRQANDDLERRVEERTAEWVRLNTAYERFVPREFLGLLKKESITDVRLADQVQREMSIMFSDIRDFTPLSESMSPQENFNFLNSYLSRVSPVIRNHRGFIDQYIGDGIMALFPDSPDDTLQAAIAMFTELDVYNTHRGRSGYQPIQIGTGVHTGNLTLGIIGGTERMQGTVIADAVNLTARLEKLTKLYGASIIISESTFKKLQAPEVYQYRFLDRVCVKGKSHPVEIYEVMNGDSEEEIEQKLNTQALLEEGFVLYCERRFTEALEKFGQALQMNSADRAVRLYVDRTERFSKQGVPEDWNGVVDLLVE
ncbi:MAG: response regulator [bacterium]|nr:response regulator [bacterium]